MKLGRKHRQVLAVLAVTTALCADQVTAAAPTLRPQVAELAGRIVTRLRKKTYFVRFLVPLAGLLGLPCI